MSASDVLRWLKPWEPVAPEAARTLEAELHLELAPHHPLFGTSARILARRIDRDDVALDLGERRYAVAHLTWAGKPDPQSGFPVSTVYASAASLQDRVDQDVIEYVS